MDGKTFVGIIGGSSLSVESVCEQLRSSGCRQNNTVKTERDTRLRWNIATFVVKR